MKERSPAEVVRLVKDEGIEVVDLRFCDLPGLMQHFSLPAHTLTEEMFTEGNGFDGSSIRGFQQIHESDMILLPDPSTAVVDPFRQHKTLNLNCFVHDPLTLEPYSRDPRYVAKKAEAYVKTTGVADTSLLRARGGVLHLRRRALLAGPALRLLPGRLRSRASGTPGVRKVRTSATSPATRRATSPSRRWTTSRTCAPR